jgi:hypothetical protein
MTCSVSFEVLGVTCPVSFEVPGVTSVRRAGEFGVRCLSFPSQRPLLQPLPFSARGKEQSGEGGVGCEDGPVLHSFFTGARRKALFVGCVKRCAELENDY